MVIIGRPINGVTINGLEYVLDGEGDLMTFADKEQAKRFLRDNGYPSEKIEEFLDEGSIVFEDVM